jgi:hypothetical protein
MINKQLGHQKRLNVEKAIMAYSCILIIMWIVTIRS